MPSSEGKMIIGLNGLVVGNNGKCMAGAGKDEVADYLVRKYNFVKVALADPMKRFCMEVFNFSEEQLWGPSKKRNEGDERYPRTVASFDTGDAFEAARFGIPDPGKVKYLSPRHALQTLGTEWGRNCYPDVWVDYAMNVAEGLIQCGPVMYIPTEGVVEIVEFGPMGEWERDDAPKEPYRGVVIPDLRFHNEKRAIEKKGGQCWRVTRMVKDIDERLLSGHLSETELLEDCRWGRELVNNKDLEHLFSQVDQIMEEMSEDVP